MVIGENAFSYDGIFLGIGVIPGSYQEFLGFVLEWHSQFCLDVAGKSCPVAKNTEKQRIARSHDIRDPKVVRLGSIHLPVAYPRSDLTSLSYPSPQRFRITGRLMPVDHAEWLLQRRLDPS